MRLLEQSTLKAKDYVFRLGNETDNMNIAVGARAGVIDDLFAGNFIGMDRTLCLIIARRSRDRSSIFKETISLLLFSWHRFLYCSVEPILYATVQVVDIVNMFPGQALDFYEAVRSQTYDGAISKMFSAERCSYWLAIGSTFPITENPPLYSVSGIVKVHKPMLLIGYSLDILVEVEPTM
ncbi:hypothetical protein SDJN03_26286, partial [Cucurbita argyrosperma subsp. sororia]